MTQKPTRPTYGIIYYLSSITSITFSLLFWLNLLFGFGNESIIGAHERRVFLLIGLLIPNFSCLIKSVAILYGTRHTSWLMPYITMITSGVNIAMIFFVLTSGI
jgi:hypothetical protein